MYEKDAGGLDRLVLLEPVGTPVAPSSLGNSASRPQAIPGSISNSAGPSVANRNVTEGENLVPPTEIQKTQPQTSTFSSDVLILSDSINVLERSLRALATRLASLSSQVPVDHETIGQVALSMGRVTEALRTVKHLHYHETSVHA